ncbi:MAG TPA: methionyl-tRNA formyltransferase, partial [Pyrinomonadaceae bacterium]
FSLLPKYRGAAPVNWAIVRGERETGVTTMLMDEGLDTGPVLLQRSTEIEEGETAPRLLERLSHVGAELLVETLERFGEIEPRRQDDTEATLAPILRREDGLIDWSLGAFEVERRVRGFQPWPNAHTTYKGRRLILWRAEPHAREAGLGDAAPFEEGAEAAGTLVVARGGELFVACGGGTTLKVLELQPEGKQRMHARDFINGSHAQAGERLG